MKKHELEAMRHYAMKAQQAPAAPAVAVPVVPTDETAKLIVDAIRCDDIGDFLRASDEIAVGVIKSALLRVTGDRK